MKSKRLNDSCRVNIELLSVGGSSSERGSRTNTWRPRYLPAWLQHNPACVVERISTGELTALVSLSVERWKTVRPCRLIYLYKIRQGSTDALERGEKIWAMMGAESGQDLHVLFSICS
jgi:hypothetical protein